MAAIIAKNYALLTLIPSVVRTGGRTLVCLQLMEGRKQIATTSFELGMLGLPELVSNRSLREAHLDLPKDAGTILEAVRDRLAPARPLWLHIPRSEPLLALFPWEEVLTRDVQAPVLRIPNFIHDPFRFGRPVRYVICASSPEAKGHYDIRQMCERLIGELLVLADRETPIEIHVFADIQAYEAGDWLGSRNGIFDFSAATVIFHNPSTAAGHGTTEALPHIPRIADGVSNPWLRWMAERLKGHTVDIMHFISPGYVDRLDGALALAVSPVDNSDREWARFVGAAELSRFLDGLGVQGLGLHSLREDEWTFGLCQLAWQMTWLRPGPVLSCRNAAVHGFGDAAELHRLLLVGAVGGLSFRSAPLLSLHPVHLPPRSREGDVQSDDSPWRHLAEKAGDSVLDAVVSTTAAFSSPFDITVSRTAIRDIIGTYARSRLEREGEGADADWLNIASRQIDSRRAQMLTVEALSHRERVETGGTAEALEFVSELLRRRGSHGEAAE